MILFCKQPSVADTLKKLKESKEAEVAGAFAGTGIPIFDSVLQSLSESLSALSSDVAASLVDQATSGLSDYLANRINNEIVATALANTVAILNLGAELQNAARAMMVHNLKRQATLRLIQLRELQFHAEGIISILSYLAKPYQKIQDPRLKMAYPLIVSALNKVRKLRAMAEAAKPRFNVSLFRSALSDVDRAITILTGKRNSTATDKFIKSVNKNTNAKKILQKFTDYLLETVVAEQVVRAETYIWHLTNFTLVIAGGDFPANIGTTTLVAGGTIPGLDPNRKNILVERKEKFNKLRKAWRVLPPKAVEPFKTMEWIDNNKGLLITHEIAMQAAQSIIDMDTGWTGLAASSKALWVMMSPAIVMLEGTESEVSQYLKDSAGASGFSQNVTTPLLFIPYIASKLIATRTMINSFGKAGEDFEAVAGDEEAWQNIRTYLQGTAYTTSMAGVSKVVKLTLPSTALALGGPLDRRLLNKALILFNDTNKALKNAINEETTLLQVLSNFNIMDNPGVMQAMRNLNLLAAQNPVAAAIAQGLISGQAGAIASMLQSVGGAITAAKDLLAGCDTIKQKTAVTNPTANANASVAEDRAKKLAKKNEALASKPAMDYTAPKKYGTITVNAEYC